MAQQQIIDEGVFTKRSRTRINDNFTELYLAGTSLGTGVATALAAATGASGGFAVNGVAGIANGYILARVELTLDGSNPTSWATGLTTIIAAGGTLKGTAAPGVGTSVITANINGTSVDFYAWKVTATGDCTLIASTGTEHVYCWAIGT